MFEGWFLFKIDDATWPSSLACHFPFRHRIGHHFRHYQYQATPTPPWNIIHISRLNPYLQYITTRASVESRGPLFSEKFLCPLLLRLPVCRIRINWNHGNRRRTLQSCTTRTCIVAVGSARTECQDH